MADPALHATAQADARHPSAAVRTGLVGVHGYGRVVLDQLRAAERRGAVEVVASADPGPAPSGDGGALPHHRGHRELLARHRLDLLVVAAPPHLHAEIALDAFARGVHVLLEKPAAPTVADVDRLIAARREAAVLCQVGYQAQSSPAVRALRAAIDGGELGTITQIGGAGRWQRADAYWQRNGWAGRLVVGDRLVLDGAFANPFSHLLMLTLFLAGTDERTPAAPTSVYAELHRANDIASDDTSYLRVRTDSGVTASLAVTLCAEQEHEPFLLVRGTRGSATLWWEREAVDLDGGGGPQRWRPPAGAQGWPPDRQRAQMLRETIAAIDGEVPDQAALPAPLEHARGPVLLANAALVACGGLPARIPEPLRIPDGAALRSVVPGVDAAVERAALTGTSFAEQELPWATPGRTVSPEEPLPALR